MLNIDMSYLTPPSHITKHKPQKEQIYEFKQGKHCRYIFCRTPLQPFETQAVSILKECLRKKAPNVFYPDELLLRFNYAGKFQMSSINEQVRLYDKWHQNQLITVLTGQGKEILEQGHIYSYGRDYEYCPVIVVRVSRVDLKKYSSMNYLNALHGLLQPLEQYMLFPGVIEKWNLLVDFENKSSKIPAQIQEQLKSLAYAYPYRLKKILFLNGRKSQESISALKELLRSVECGSEAIQLHELGGLMQFIAADEREKKYAGSLPDLCEYWPVHTTSKYEQSLMHSQEGQIQSDYHSVDHNNEHYFKQDSTPFCDITEGKCNIY